MLTLATLGMAAVAHGLAIRDSCEFGFTIGGAITGPVGQISSGQVRAGDGISAATFTIQGDEVWDSKGRGCWWTPPTLTLQCDPGQDPDNGFDIACDGKVSYKGQTTFYECDTETEGQHNIYLEPNGVGCSEVTLHADGCHAECEPTPPPPEEDTCPTNLDGAYEFPHLIIPVDSSKPDHAPGTSLFGVISESISSIFNFDIPAEDEGKTCSLVFLFPKKEDLETSDYVFSGDGELSFSKLKAPATEGTTFNNAPDVEKELGEVTIAPGNEYRIATFDCPAGKRVAYEVSATGHTSLNYFQDYNPAPIGLYITKC